MSESHPATLSMVSLGRFTSRLFSLANLAQFLADMCLRVTQLHASDGNFGKFVSSICSFSRDDSSLKLKR